ncbi:lysin A [Mycobacterium phage Dorothy]|uniref:Lysin A n=2 Tax=Cheoctovirus TaxID=1623281 RepID=R4JPZ6_9CAUD|nr:endolysin [Mycobacterium phage SiSi]YP_009592005.1 endolysin [Mycobacterium phage Dorothy]AFQ97425.1 lysin A [Mycobacterium phage Dorothy]AGK87866.1 lysin A [Mycobacterium phage SiSi]
MTTKDQVAQITIAEAKARGYTRSECLAIMSTFYQESGWNDTIWDPTHTTYGIAQQDGSYPHRFDGAAAQIKGFFDKLDVWRAKPGASTDIWLNICWMQQAPNWPSADYWYANGRRAYLTEIKSRITTVTPYLDKYWQTTGGTAVTWTGDPVWLEDVLREALGDRLVVAQADWKERGTGGVMGDIWGVMIHHTGNDRETVAGIRDGRPDLRGPLSQCLITPDGKCHLIAVGPCNHAGTGSYPGVGTNNGNQRLIGFECAWPTIRPDGSFDPAQRWPDAQIITMRDATAAVLKRLGRDSKHVIGHKEWAGATQGKWDPGNLDMNWFRGEVQKDLDGFLFPGEQPSAPQPGPALPPDYDKEVWDQLRILWPQLGHRTLVDAVAAIGAKLGIEGCYDVKGKS